MNGHVNVHIGGRTLRLSNLDKVFYPASGFTKGQAIDYYVHIAEVVLPHIRNRPLTMARYPNGVSGPMFYQKRCPEQRPEWVHQTLVWSETYQRDVSFCIIDDVATLVWLVNLAAIELHPFLATAENVYSPTLITFDLDPGPGATLAHCAWVALRLRALLRETGLECYPKSSGKKGLHVNVPLNTPTTYEVTKSFAHTLAQFLEKYYPDQVTANMRKDLRVGKVFVDWSQNDQHKSTVCVYSIRAWHRPTVSAPLQWEEVVQAAETGDPSGLIFETGQVLERVQRLGDLHAPVANLTQHIPKLTAV